MNEYPPEMHKGAKQARYRQEGSKYHPCSCSNTKTGEKHCQDPSAHLVTFRDIRHLEESAVGSGSTSASPWISFTSATGRVCDWNSGFRDEIRLNDFQSTHLLTDTGGAVPDSVGSPLGATSHAVGSTVALCSGSLSGSAELFDDTIVGERSHLGRGGHPAGEVGLEGQLVGITVPAWLAGIFVHDIGSVVEEDLCAVEEALDPNSPFFSTIGLLWVSESTLGEGEMEHTKLYIVAAPSK